MSEIRVKSTGTIKLYESDNTSHVTIASPASLSANRTITIPDADVTLGAGTTINNNADNRVITGSGTANTLEGEANLTFDGTDLDVGASAKISSNGAIANFSNHNGSATETALASSDGNEKVRCFNDGKVTIETGGVERQRIASNSIPAWHLIYSDNVSGMGSGSNAYTASDMFSSTYDFYRIYILNWEPQNDGVDMNLQFKLGGTTRTNNYRFNLRRNESNSASVTGAYDNGASSIRIMEGCGSGTSENMSGFFEYQNPTGDNGNFYVTNAMYSGIETNGYTIGGVGQGSCSDSTGAMTGFTIAAHSGGLGNYNLRAYGLKTS